MFKEESAYHGVLECNSALRNNLDEIKDSALPQEMYMKWLGHHQENSKMEQTHLDETTTFPGFLQMQGSPPLRGSGSTLPTDQSKHSTATPDHQKVSIFPSRLILCPVFLPWFCFFI